MKRSAHAIQLVTSFAGVLLSLYLLVSHTFLFNGIQEGSSFCAVGGFADCDVVTASPYSVFAGVPLASWGALFFFVLFVLSLVAKLDVRFSNYSQRWIARLAILGLAIDVLLLVIQLVAIQFICLLCIATYALNLVAFLTALALLAGPAPLKSGMKSVWISEAVAPGRGKAFLPYFIAIFLFGGVLYLLPLALKLKSQTYAFVDSALEQFYSRWTELPTKPVDVAPENPVFGNPTASLTFVEFSDLQCPHCRRAAFTLHAALAPYANKVKFVFKNFPLDSSCNPHISTQMHPHACNLARLGFCAHKKGKFWEFHDEVFLKIPEREFRGTFETLADKLSGVLTRDEISQCLRDPKSLAAVQADIKNGMEIGVKGTPTLFVNGRQVTIPVTVQAIQKLIEMSQ
jgi:protein-disulfide isomerase/uncharacterized membrane protein